MFLRRRWDDDAGVIVVETIVQPYKLTIPPIYCKISGFKGFGIGLPIRFNHWENILLFELYIQYDFL